MEVQNILPWYGGTYSNQSSFKQYQCDSNDGLTSSSSTTMLHRFTNNPSPSFNGLDFNMAQAYYAAGDLQSACLMLAAFRHQASHALGCN